MWRRVVIIWFIVWVTEVRGLEQPPEYPVDDFNISSCEFDGPYAASTMTYFEKQCPLQNPDRNSTFCYCYLSIYDELNDHHDHDTVPYIIITIFASFAIGSFIRHMLSSFELRIPYTVILFIVGLGWGELSTVTELGLEQSVKISEMNPHLIFHIFLPVLIFESAFAMEIPVFKKVVSHCVTLAGPGLMVASALTAVTAKYLFTQYPWSWEACALFGTILSATDPVAVVALLKDLGASPIISTLIEGESLFNDGTAIVFFSVFEEAVEDGGFHKGIGTVLLQFLVVAFGGPLIGFIIGMIAVASLNRVFNDALIEVTLTVVSAYVTFFVCEGFFGVSGVLGVVTCGCFMSHYRHSISPEVVHTLHHFWEMTVYLTNTLIFMLAGMIVALKSFKSIDAYDVLYLVYTYIAINVIRGFVLVLFNFCCFRPFRLNYQLDLGNGCLVAWGGLRGAVGLALALLIFENEKIRVTAPSVADKILFHTAGIVMLTLCINGVTTQNVVAKFKLSEVEYRKRKRIHDIWRNLKKEQHEDYIDLGADAMMYDADWKTVRSLSDLSTTLPDAYEDPYNPKGWYAKRDLFDTDDVVKRKEREEGKAAYINTIAASAMAQYKLGTLRRQGIREMTKLFVRARDITTTDDPPAADRSDESFLKLSAVNPRTPRNWTGLSLIQTEWIEKLFERAKWEDKVRFSPAIDEWLLRWRWQNAVDMSLAFIQCHQVCRNKIRNLAEREVANQIDNHCKVTIQGIVSQLAKVAKERPDISCALKTRSACRKILNTMHTEVVRMQHGGRLDQEDAAALNKMIFQQMEKVQNKFKRTLEGPEPCEMVETLSYFEQSDRKTRNEILDISRKESLIHNIPRNQKLFDKIDKRDLLLVMSGIIQIRVGRKVFRYGSGYTCGWQMCLTNNDRFSDIWTETATTVLQLPHESVISLLETDSEFKREAWRCLGETTARILIALDDSFDPRVWDDVKIRKTAETGVPIFLQDPEGFEFDNIQQHKLKPDTYLCLLRGKSWEYGDERDHIGGSLCRFPTMLPVDFKFATFTNHAVLYEMNVDLTSAARARRLWGFLKTKVKSIILWSALRGPKIARVSLALAFSTSLPPDLADDEEMLREMSEAKKLEANQSTIDKINLEKAISEGREVPLLKPAPKPVKEVPKKEPASLIPDLPGFGDVDDIDATPFPHRPHRPLEGNAASRSQPVSHLHNGEAFDPIPVESDSDSDDLLLTENPETANILAAPSTVPVTQSMTTSLFGLPVSSPTISQKGARSFAPLQFPVSSSVFRSSSIHTPQSSKTDCPLEAALAKNTFESIVLPQPPNFTTFIDPADL